MKYLNCGCGKKYIVSDEWVNIDFATRDKNVRKVNILRGLPYEDACFDGVYSSCMLEHFTREQADMFLLDAYRVIKPGGIIRLVIPDLENVCLEYLKMLNMVKRDKTYSEKYEYIVIELLDQMTRLNSGGEMQKYWEKDDADMEYVKKRTGFPADYNTENSNKKIIIKRKMLGLLCRNRWIDYVKRGKFTLSGEQHKWMYDAYSIQKLLNAVGFKDTQIMTYNNSEISGWNRYELEIDEAGNEYKPNCIYVEGKR